MNDCEHGFVVRDIEGDNRFLCRECDTRFARYPRKIDWQKAYDKVVNWDIVKDALKTFEPGFVERMNQRGFASEYMSEISKPLPMRMTPVVEKIE